MSTVKFSEHKKLKKLQSRILLEANIELTQQEILEIAVDILNEDIDIIIDKLSRGSKVLDEDEIDKMINQYSTDWGEGTEDSSSTIDEVLYG